MNDETIIRLDGSGWRNAVAFLTALKAAIQAPDWHGASPDAFIDSMIWGGINALDPPYTILVTGLEHAPDEVVSYVDLISRCLVEADKEHLARKGARVNVRVSRCTPGA